MKSPKLNPLILDAFDCVVQSFYHSYICNDIEEFKHFKMFLQELTICTDVWDTPLPAILHWDSNQKLILISFLAILSDKELEEFFSIVPSFDRSK